MFPADFADFRRINPRESAKSAGNKKKYSIGVAGFLTQPECTMKKMRTSLETKKDQFPRISRRFFALNLKFS